jgi:hypothetical protein
VFNWRSSVALIAVFVLAPLPVDAARSKKAKPPKVTKSLTQDEQLAAAEVAYEDYDYATAASLLQQLLNKAVSNAKLRQRAWLLLGFSRHFLRDEPAAKSALAELFRENVDYPFERELHHPDLVRLFDTERNAYLASISVTPASQPITPPVIIVAPASEPTASQPVIVETPKAAVQTLGDRQPWLRIFPIVGHFANHDYVGGGVFLALETAFIGMNVGGAVAYAMLRYPEGDFRSGAFEAQIIQNVGGVGAIALAVICIVDAFAWSPARGRASLERSLAVSLGPLGDYRLVFR